MKTCYITIQGRIGSRQMADGTVAKGIELLDVVLQAKQYPGFERVEVSIDSPGGNPDIAFDIANYIESLSADFVTIIKNMCGSAATVISLKAKPENRKILAGSAFFIHNPSLVEISGDADQLLSASEFIRAEEDKFAKYYSKQTGLGIDAVYPLMKVETQMTAEQAKELGFVNEIIPAAVLKPVAYYTPKTQTQNSTDMKEVKTLTDAVNALLTKLNIKQAEKKFKKIALVCKVALLDLTTQDGVSVVVETEGDVPAIGDAITMADGTPCADGKYSFDQGVLVVAGGIITDVLPPDAAAHAPAADITAKETEIAALKAQLATKDTEIATLKTADAANKTAIVDLSTKVELIAKATVGGYTPPKGGKQANRGDEGQEEPRDDYFSRQKAAREAEKKAAREKK